MGEMVRGLEARATQGPALLTDDSSGVERADSSKSEATRVIKDKMLS